MGILYLVATPIGTRSDVSVRAIEILCSVDHIYAEDTRHFKKLTEFIHEHFPGKSVTHSQYRFDEHTEQKMIPTLLRLLDQDKTIALVSDAGTPLVSDPGYRLVQYVLNNTHHTVTSIPGPSAVTNAVILSGLPPHPYMFTGFFPNTPAKIRTIIKNAFAINAIQSTTFVSFLSPYKVDKTIEAFIQEQESSHCFITLVLLVEMTKKFEQRYTGSPHEILSQVHHSPVKGECTVVWSFTAKQ